VGVVLSSVLDALTISGRWCPIKVRLGNSASFTVTNFRLRGRESGHHQMVTVLKTASDFCSSMSVTAPLRLENRKPAHSSDGFNVVIEIN
jgi:hypothetical protein